MLSDLRTWEVLSDIRPGLDFAFTTCKEAERKLQRHIKISKNPWVFIRHLSMDSFKELDNNFNTYARADYFDDIKLAVLYMKMPSKLHGKLTRQLTRIFDDKARAMGMSPFEFQWAGDSTFDGFRRCKEADDCFFPTEDVNIEDWSVLVIETGVSETLPQLHRDAIWWFNQSPEVTYVLLVNVDRSQRTIHIEKWERCRPREPRLTQSHREAVPDPSVSEIATISGTGVTGTFTLSFDLLFKRPATGAQHDLTFGHELRWLWGNGSLFLSSCPRSAQIERITALDYLLDVRGSYLGTLFPVLRPCIL